MAAGRFSARYATPSVLFGVLLCSVAGCGSSTSDGSAEGRELKSRWKEPASYSYTLTSTTQVLAGTFRVKVSNGEVAAVVGLDEDSQRQVRNSRGKVPTMGGLLAQLQLARKEDADTAVVDYAADGHPVRISLDWDKNAIDDEARYTISSYEPTPR